MQALYRLYRPQKFSELVGQEHVSDNLLKALEIGKISHAFLFVGPRGTGKTSTARILAKSLNCLKAKDGKWTEPCGECESCLAISTGSYLDLIEIDAASNRGIDEIRDLREKIKLAPTQGEFKVYIIDEVHMLTSEAFNALLKTLEEPPEHAKFILCTTDPQKIPSTIKSRCQVFEFKIPTLDEIVKVLDYAVKEESASAKATVDKKVEVKKEDLVRIAKKAKGAYRDALVLLEKYLVTGVVDHEIDFAHLSQFYYQGNSREAFQIINKGIEMGISPKGMAESLIDYNRKALLVHLGMGTDVKKDTTDSEWAYLESYVKETQISKIKELLGFLTSSLEEFRFSPIPQLPLELAIVANDSSNTVITSPESSEGRGNLVEIISTPTTESTEVDSEKKEIATSAMPPRKDILEVNSGDVVEVKIATKDSNTTINIKKSGELESIQAQWIELLRKLRPINHSLEALLRSSEPVDYQDGKLTLSFFYRFHKERVEDPKNRALVEKVFHEQTGLPVSLNLVLSDNPRPISKREASQKEVQNVKIVDDKDIGEAALDIFSN